MQIALVTDSINHNTVDDDTALIAVLQDNGIIASHVVWNDQSIEWDRFDLAIIRSTWDYPCLLDNFTKWIDLVSSVTRLLNPPEILKWNLNKRYLAELQNKGINVVPTTYISNEIELVIPELKDYVIKPLVSNSGENSGRFNQNDGNETPIQLIKDILQNTDVMIQPYISSIDTIGEKSLIFFGDKYSHAIVKGPILKSGGGKTKFAGTKANTTRYEPSDLEIDFSMNVLDSIPANVNDIAYARVDIASINEIPLLMEIELVEPYLFLYSDTRSIDNFIRRIKTL